MSSLVVMCNGEKNSNGQSSSPLTSLNVCIISPQSLLCANVGSLSSFNLSSYGRSFRFDSSFVLSLNYPGPFPAILGKGPWLELGKICSILGNYLEVLNSKKKNA